MRSGWASGTPLLDPMCGSGTLLIEAAMLATDRAPGLHRGHWGFGGWAQHDDAIWKEVKSEAQTRARQGLAAYESRFYGSDVDARVIERAQRNARRMLGQMSKGKDFLNLFSYTGSASVHAGLGGARSTTTVDMSRTYLEWAERNLRLNGLTGRAHRLMQADVLGWLRETTEQFDLIFIDPPTFSNSKRMDDAFDVQRDHLRLMTDLKRLLRKGGTIMFSNNKRGFRMDHDGLAQLGLKAQEITQKTLSQDFARNRQIHNCWLITAA